MFCIRIFCIKYEDLDDYSKIAFMFGAAYVIELIFLIVAWVVVLKETVLDATHDVASIMMIIITILSIAALANWVAVYCKDEYHSKVNAYMGCTMLTVLLKSYSTFCFLFYQGLYKAFVDEVGVMICLPISLVFCVLWTQAFFGISNKIREDFFGYDGGMKRPING